MSAPPAGRVRRVAAAIAGVAAVALLAAGGWLGYRAVLSQPLERVTFAGETAKLPAAELEALAEAIRNAAPGSVTLASVREAARRVPWVRDASVRRTELHAIEITFEAHEAFARWNDAALISTRGEIFAAAAAGTLPRLRGPEGSGPAMLAQYAALSKSLAPLGSPIAELRLSARGAWQARLASGLAIELGRDDTVGRAARLAGAWPQVAERAPRSVDLRYSNGFAMSKT